MGTAPSSTAMAGGKAACTLPEAAARRCAAWHEAERGGDAIDEQHERSARLRSLAHDGQDLAVVVNGAPPIHARSVEEREQRREEVAAAFGRVDKLERR